MTDNEIQQLIIDGWHQVSARYRTIARLPEGKTGRRALFEASQEQYAYLDENMRNYWTKHNTEWVCAMSESECTDQFLRVHANNRNLWRTLNEADFRAFRRLGGRGAR